jgi:DNA-binding CsgD family transcriptional regulator
VYDRENEMPEALTTIPPINAFAAAAFEPRGSRQHAQPAAQPIGYRGPERRSTASAATRWLAQMLDHVDYGMLLLVDGSQVLHVNRAARTQLDSGHPLQLLGSELRARQPQDVARLHDALVGAQRGLRKLVTLGEIDSRVSIAVVPLGMLGLGGPQATLLLMGKPIVCQQLTVQMFARSHALTPAETRVLEALCGGLDPREVADRHGVGLATVRTQIGQIRLKTGADSIRDLIGRIAALPPILGLVGA